MSKEDNSGAAFPTKGGMVFYVPDHIQDSVKKEIDALKRETEGMTLRDYFAAKALAALISVVPGGTSMGVSHPETNGGLAKASYAMADAMLEARKK